MSAQPQEHFDVMNDTLPIGKKKRISKILTFIWEFHTMHPDHAYFPKRKRNSPICISHILTGAWSNTKWAAS